MSRNMNRCSQRRTTVARDRGRPLGLATATGFSAGRQPPSQPPLSRASGERRSVLERRSRAQAQRARKLARAFWWGARTASARPPGLHNPDVVAGVDTNRDGFPHVLQQPQMDLATTTATGVDMNRDGLPNVLQQPQMDLATTTATGVNVNRDSLPNVLQQPQIDLATTSVTGVDMNRHGLPNVLQQSQIDLVTTTVTGVDMNRDGPPNVLQQSQIERVTVTGVDINHGGFPNVLQQPQIDCATTTVTGVETNRECGLAHQGFDTLSQYGAQANMGMMTVKGTDMNRDVDPNFLQQPLIGIASSQICDACSSRDGLTADLECDGTHYNFPVTHESGEAIEDLTKDEVEHLVILLRELVDVLCRRQEGGTLSHGRYDD